MEAQVRMYLDDIKYTYFSSSTYGDALSIPLDARRLPQCGSHFPLGSLKRA